MLGLHEQRMLVGIGGQNRSCLKRHQGFLTFWVAGHVLIGVTSQRLVVQQLALHTYHPTTPICSGNGVNRIGVSQRRRPPSNDGGPRTIWRGHHPSDPKPNNHGRVWHRADTKPCISYGV